MSIDWSDEKAMGCTSPLSLGVVSVAVDEALESEDGVIVEVAVSVVASDEDDWSTLDDDNGAADAMFLAL